MSKARAKKIKVLLFDVDGVMTDGTLWFFPSPAGARRETESHAAAFDGKAGYAVQSSSFMEAKGFHAHDGTGISLARLGGLKCGLITKRISDTVALRARDLKLEFVYQGCADKVSAMRDVMAKEKVSAEEICFVGDDVIDLPVMRRCGLAVAVANAREEVKDEAHFVTDRPGGRGAIRDIIEYILRAQGKLDSAVAEYIQERSPKKQS